ncbi:hypothetical protein AC579_7123 [Pseudocercospora musae]|uniref:Uncharacterized protein n=1 Tax=Pseudocercospora musae TaxID=113226 RepID=A0A139IMP5_9PEZI|nr:hypothetical protein AC579_7123 [Pseudocercospora musae]
MSLHGFTPPPLPNSSPQAGMTQPASALYLYKSLMEESAYDDQNNTLPYGWIRRTETHTWTTFVNHRTGQQERVCPNLCSPHATHTVSLSTPSLATTHTPDTMPFPSRGRHRRRARRSGRKSASRGGNDDPHASNKSQTSPALHEDDEFDHIFKEARGKARTSQAFGSAPPPDPTLDAMEPSAAPTLAPLSEFAQTATEWPPETTSDHPPARVQAIQKSRGPNKRPFEDYSAGNEGAEAELPDKKILRKQ